MQHARSVTNLPRAAALRLHALGFNVCAIAQGAKRPAHPWNDAATAPWAVERQPREVVETLGHGWTQRRRIVNGQVLPPIDRVGIVCGVGDIRCIDIDAVKDAQGRPMAPVPETIYAALLERLRLPPDYRWGGRSASGAGWHLWLRCPDPSPTPMTSGVALWRPRPEWSDAFGAVELRWSSCQTALPRTATYIGYYPDTLESAPAPVPLERILAAVSSIAVATSDESTRPHLTTRNGAHPPQNNDDARAWLDWLNAAQPGQRNIRLHRAAVACGRLAAAGACAPAMRDALVAAGERLGLPSAEAERTVESGWTWGMSAAPSLRPRLRDAVGESSFDEPISVVWGADIDRIPPPIPLIDGMLTIGKVTLLVGPSEAGKSTVAVHIACQVAQHYPILYVAAESADMVRNQIRAWELAHGRSRGRFGLIPQSTPLPQAVDSLIAVACESHARLIIIDTLSACTPGRDENNARDMSAVIDSVNRLADAAEAAVLVIHHPSKNGASSFRGHSLIVNNTHTMLLLKPDSDHHGAVMLSAERHKGVRPPPLRLTIGRIDITEDVYSERWNVTLSAPTVMPPSAAPADRSSALPAVQRSILTLLHDLEGEGGLDTRDLARLLCERERISESIARSEIARAARAGWITANEPPALRRLTAHGRAILERERAQAAIRRDIDVNPNLPPQGRRSAAPSTPADSQASALPPAAQSPDLHEVWHDC